MGGSTILVAVDFDLALPWWRIMTRERVGICFPDRPDFPTLLATAKRADELGFESIVVFETR